MKTDNSNASQPTRKPLRLKDFDYSDPNHVYFLTICAREGATPFSDKDLSTQLVSTLLFYRREKEFRLYCFCVMPDHVHLVMSPSTGSSVSEVVKSLKTFTARVARGNGMDGKLWQK